MYNRKTITYKIYEPPRKVLQNAGAQAFRGFVGGDVRYSLCLEKLNGRRFTLLL
jgi:hypothetical protein